MLDFEFVICTLAFNITSKWDHSVHLDCVTLDSDWEWTDLHLIDLESLLFELSLQLGLVIEVDFESLVNLFFSFRCRFNCIAELI